MKVLKSNKARAKSFEPPRSSAKKPISGKRLELSNQVVQRKVKVGAVNDPMEAEADRVANAVMSGESAQVTSMDQAPVQRQCTECASEEAQMIQREPEEEEEMLQTKSNGGCLSCSAESGEKAASAVASGGQRLSDDVRSYFEPRFGQDFSDVRVHTHSGAERASRDINAKAFTTGRNIAFSSGQYSPHSTSGRRLLAHELAHVVQQGSGKEQTVQRKVAKDSTCSADAPGASQNQSTGFLKMIDRRARRFARRSARRLRRAAQRPNGRRSQKTIKAFRESFGGPTMNTTGFTNRFDGSNHGDEDTALHAEMGSLSANFSAISNRFADSIRYRCIADGSNTLQGQTGENPEEPKTECNVDCTSREGKIYRAFICPGTSFKEVGVCHSFWTIPGIPSMAGVLVHEVAHGLLDTGNQHSVEMHQRPRNAGCYDSFMGKLLDYPAISEDCPAPSSTEGEASSPEAEGGSSSESTLDK